MNETVRLLAHTSWILGFALVLATFSYRSWQRSQPEAPGGPTPLLVPIGLILGALGLLVLSPSWLERGGWGLLIALSLYALLRRGEACA